MPTKRKPRDEAEAGEWLKLLASNLRDIAKKQAKALRPLTKKTRHAVPQWIEPPITTTLLRSDLATRFADAVDAYFLETPAGKKPRARSLDAALGLKPRVGTPEGMRSYGEQTAIDIYRLECEGLSQEEIANRLGINGGDAARTVRRIRKVYAGAIVKYRFSLGGSARFGYDLKDGKLIVNKREAAIVRMIFERCAQFGSALAQQRARIPVRRELKAKGIIDEHGKLVDDKHDAATARTILERHVQSGVVSTIERAFTALVRELKTKGVTDKQGKPFDKVSLHRLLNDRVYIGKALKGMYRGKHKAIISLALWREVGQTNRVLMPVSPRKRARAPGQ